VTEPKPLTKRQRSICIRMIVEWIGPVNPFVHESPSDKALLALLALLRAGK
jgi:hypothetical protein